MRAKTALAIALFGLVVSPLLTDMLGSRMVSILVAAAFAATGIALFPEPARAGAIES